MDPTLYVAVSELKNWTKRYRALRKYVRETIEKEGGTLKEMTMIGMLLRSPFPKINIRPVYLKAHCQYTDDSGTWYICGAENGVHWVWSSDQSRTVPPVRRPYEMLVNNHVLALPRWASILLYFLFLVIVFGGLALLIKFA
ncbi:MAG TPA: hypothetical protein PK014_03970 [Thermoanaerobaculia bacterium]|nr:hypothetical protein [Thermoanaerobaculia bacterium]HUM29213.1 hypothetical protein [Thermoanaerobaculia bacterium]HXK67828.1 hypothetical protein [Thermoanaerobaculia bacterium]